MSYDLWTWAAFAALIVGMLALDLFVFHRHAHVISLREAATWSVVWIALGLLFGGLVWAWRGTDAAGEYLAADLIEKSLAVDNILVFPMLIGYFTVPAVYQHRILF